MPVGKLAKARADAAARLCGRIPTLKRSSTFVPKLVDLSSALLRVLADPDVSQTLARLKLGAHVTRLIDNMEKVLDKFLVLRAAERAGGHGMVSRYNSLLPKFEKSGKPACAKIVVALKALKGPLSGRLPMQDLVVKFESLSYVRLQYKRR